MGLLGHHILNFERFCVVLSIFSFSTTAFSRISLIKTAKYVRKHQLACPWFVWKSYIVFKSLLPSLCYRSWLASQFIIEFGKYSVKFVIYLVKCVIYRVLSSIPSKSVTQHQIVCLRKWYCMWHYIRNNRRPYDHFSMLWYWYMNTSSPSELKKTFTKVDYDWLTW